MIDLKSDNGSLKEIISIFVSPLIMVIVNAVNCTTKRENEHIDAEDAVHFI